MWPMTKGFNYYFQFALVLYEFKLLLSKFLLYSYYFNLLSVETLSAWDSYYSYETALPAFYLFLLRRPDICLTLNFLLSNSEFWLSWFQRWLTKKNIFNFISKYPLKDFFISTMCSNFRILFFRSTFCLLIGVKISVETIL